jgi:hypothetical protein
VLGGELAEAQVHSYPQNGSKGKQSHIGTKSGMPHLILHLIFNQQPERLDQQIEQHRQTNISKKLFDVD